MVLYLIITLYNNFDIQLSDVLVYYKTMKRSINKNKHTIIIGAGPGGSSAAIYIARTLWPITLIDAGEKIPGRTSMATSLQNFLGNTEMVSGGDFLEKVNSQLEKYEINRINNIVEEVRYDDNFFHVHFDGVELISKYLIMAIGVEDIMPEIPGMEPYYEHSIFHCLTCDWYRNKDKKAIYVIDGDRGLESVIARTTLNKPEKVSVVPGADKKSVLSEDLVNRALDLGINIYKSSIIKLVGKEGVLEKTVLKDGNEVDAEVMFTLLGHKRRDQFLDNGDIFPLRDSKGFLRVEFQTLETSIPNLFAVGPCNQGPDQAIIAAGQGAMAADVIHRRILKDQFNI